MLAHVLTATLRLLPLEGLLSCCTDDALSYLNHSMPLVIPILKKKFSGFVWSLSPPNTLLFHGGTMVELHHVPPVANLPSRSASQVHLSNVSLLSESLYCVWSLSHGTMSVTIVPC